jgi:hypothetical protein
MFVLFFSFGAAAKIVAFNLGDKFMLQIQDSVNDTDASELFKSLDIEIEGDPTVLEIKNFNLTSGIDDIVSIRCTRFLRFDNTTCVMKIYKTKYSKFDLNKGKIELLVDDSKALKFSKVFFGNGIVYEDGLKSVYIEKNGSSRVFLSYNF